eukprot:710310-Hanusia_phi.AAC.2
MARVMRVMLLAWSAGACTEAFLYPSFAGSSMTGHAPFPALSVRSSSHKGSSALTLSAAPRGSGPVPHRPLLSRRTTTMRANLDENRQSDGDTKIAYADLLPKLTVWFTWAMYIFHVFFSDAPCGGQAGEMCNIGLPVTMEAINLSFNFWFIMPALFPDFSPNLHPALEAFFNIVVAWGALFFGFLSDGSKQKVPMLPFMVGTAFLTNVFYLPYLGLREPYEKLQESSETRSDSAEGSKVELKISESKALPLLLTTVFLVSMAWGAYARGSEYGDVATRLATLWQMVSSSDRLAHSFAVDSLVFWVFQGWLVPDDMKRRGYKDDSALLIARSVPFFGLVYYLLVRPDLDSSANA